MKVWVTGGNSGQLKQELMRTVPQDVVLVGLDSPRIDITNVKAVEATIESHRPDWIINTAAYTAVDEAESDRGRAFAVNHAAVSSICQAASSSGARVLQVSTDFVFGGSACSPLAVDAPTEPCSVYGESKRAGEQEVLSILPSTGLIVRTSWVYSSFGHNFVKTMLKLMRKRDTLGVVADQVGSPTWANNLAQVLWIAVGKAPAGILHWTGAGVATWYDFAVAIHDEGRMLGLLDNDVQINPLRSDQYPTPATRPAYSVMDISSTTEQLDHPPEHWRRGLGKMMRELV